MIDRPAASTSDRLVELLDPAPEEPRWRGPRAGGYLDLLGEAPSPHDTIAQRLMRSGVLPKIYEDVWRPLLFGLFKGGPLGPSTEQEYALARDWLGLSRNRDATVLDVACGPGNVSRALAAGLSPNGLVVGIDAAATMLDRAVAETSPGIVYVRGDAVHLPFRAGSFDAVCCFGALYLFDDPWTAIDGMTRVLRPGGRIVFLTSRRPRTPLVGRAGAALGRATGIRLFAPEEVPKALAARGFTDVRRRAYGLMQFVGGTRQSVRISPE
jgi:SAM-dependent methyltransferase